MKKETFWTASETEWKGVLGLQAVTVVPLEEAATIGQREEQRVSTRLVLRWQENDSRHVADVWWCAHGFRFLTFTKLNAIVRLLESHSSNIMMQILAPS